MVICLGFAKKSASWQRQGPKNDAKMTKLTQTERKKKRKNLIRGEGKSKFKNPPEIDVNQLECVSVSQ